MLTKQWQGKNYRSIVNFDEANRFYGETVCCNDENNKRKFQVCSIIDTKTSVTVNGYYPHEFLNFTLENGRPCGIECIDEKFELPILTLEQQRAAEICGLSILEMKIKKYISINGYDENNHMAIYFNSKTKEWTPLIVDYDLEMCLFKITLKSNSFTKKLCRLLNENNLKPDLIDIYQIDVRP
jgi:hypothetical protein